MHACHSSGHPKVLTSSRGSPKGRSNAPTQLGDWTSAVKKSGKLLTLWSCPRRTRSPAQLPQASTICLRLLGALEKSQPSKGPLTPFEAPSARVEI
jgi:hypothetical protein